VLIGTAELLIGTAEPIGTAELIETLLRESTPCAQIADAADTKPTPGNGDADRPRP
jgi:hypothetical protein